jgi:enoyl-CoA hydratase
MLFLLSARKGARTVATTVVPMSVSFERDGGVGIISIDDGKANALSPDVLSAIAECFDKAEADGASAVLLQGRPGRFSAGFDLSIMTSGVEPMRALVTQGAELLLRIFTFPAPVVSACTGHALAAGALVLLVSDVRVGAEGEFKIGLNEVAIGMGLPIFAVELARYRMPPSAFDSALLGEVFAPADAVRAGYLDRTSGSVLDDALATAQRLSSLRRGAVSISKDHARATLAQKINDTLYADMAGLSGPAT